MNNDFIRNHADHVFDKTMLTLNESPLYVSFFNAANFEYLVKLLEQNYNIILSESYRRDVVDMMIRCFDYHPPNLKSLNNLVLTQLRPMFSNLRMEQNRYKQNVYDNQTTAFIFPENIPEQVCKRKESLSFMDALFGPNECNVAAFRQFRTG